MAPYGRSSASADAWLSSFGIVGSAPERWYARWQIQQRGKRDERLHSIHCFFGEMLHRLCFFGEMLHRLAMLPVPPGWRGERRSNRRGELPRGKAGAVSAERLPPPPSRLDGTRSKGWTADDRGIDRSSATNLPAQPPLGYTVRDRMAKMELLA